jgi:hypothetical protein
MSNLTLLGSTTCQAQAPVGLSICRPNVLEPKIALDSNIQHENLESSFPYTLVVQKVL